MSSAATQDGDLTRPRIGLTTSEIRYRQQLAQRPQGEPVQTEIALGLTYIKAIEAAGGIPFVMPPLEDPSIEPMLETLDGLCLSGGPDLDPRTYGQRHHPELGPTEPEIDRFELSLLGAAWKRQVPVLGLCRGAQAINVARGGTLFQHLPELANVTLEHRQNSPAWITCHTVSIEPGSLLGRIMGRDEVEVNTLHHQAPDRIGEGLRVVARSPDGVAEGLEAPDLDFMLGVQWHAETLTERPEHRALFEALVAAARKAHTKLAEAAP